MKCAATIVLTCVMLLPLTMGQRFVCYFPNWTVYREGNGQFTVDMIDPSLCTHYIYSFAKLNDVTCDSIEVLDEWADINLKGYEKFVALKDKNPNIKTMIAIGGWTDSLTDKYSQLVANPDKIANFVTSVMAFLQKYKFDGLDLDWEFPYKVDTDKAGFANLIKALKNAFKDYGYLLSSAVAVNKTIIDLGYDISAMNSNLDFINVMAYDMHGPWEDTVDNHAPLYKRSWEEANDNNIDFIINYFIQKRMPASKINMGIPFYGKSWTLASTNTTIGAPGNGPGPAGPYTKEPGTLAYNEICAYVGNNGWTVVQDPEKQTGPYAYSPGTSGQAWVGYDDADMVRVKTAYASGVGMSLGGVMIWELSNDDFGNLCGQGKNPLQRAIFETLYPDATLPTDGPTESTSPSVSSGSTSPTTSTTPTTTTGRTTTTLSTSPSPVVTTVTMTRGPTSPRPSTTEPPTTARRMPSSAPKLSLHYSIIVAIFLWLI